MALLDNLISYWSLEEASGSRADATATGNTLTDNFTVTQQTGKIANCAQLTAANSEYLSRADNASLSTGNIDFSVAAWVYLDSIVNGTIASKWVITGNQREYLLFYNNTDHAPNNRFSLLVSATGTSTIGIVDATSFGAASTATWYFVVAWHDSVADTINICVNDGTVNSVAHTTGVFDGTGAFDIGRIANLYFWNGRIDEVAFAKRVWTAAEITWMYNGGAGRSYADWLAFDAAVGHPTMRRGGLVDYIGQPLEVGRSNVRVF